MQCTQRAAFELVHTFTFFFVSLLLSLQRRTQPSNNSKSIYFLYCLDSSACIVTPGCQRDHP
jgi:hypothetical protein